MRQKNSFNEPLLSVCNFAGPTEGMKIQDEYTWFPSKRELTHLNEIPSEQRITIQHGTKKKHINVRVHACMHTHTQTQNTKEKYSIEEEQLTETGGGFTRF